MNIKQRSFWNWGKFFIILLLVLLIIFLLLVFPEYALYILIVAGLLLLFLLFRGKLYSGDYSFSFGKVLGIIIMLIIIAGLIFFAINNHTVWPIIAIGIILFLFVLLRSMVGGSYGYSYSFGNIFGLLFIVTIIGIALYLAITMHSYWPLAIIGGLIISYFLFRIIGSIVFFLFGILRMFAGLLFIGIAIAFFVFNFSNIKIPDGTEHTESDDDYMPEWEPIKQDSLSNDSNTINILKNTISWEDYNNNNYEFSYIVNEFDYNKAKENRTNADGSWNEIYGKLYQNDYNLLNDMVKHYDSLKTGLNSKQFAELIVTSVQNQKYVWVLSGSCKDPKYIWEITKSGCDCIGNIRKYAVQSPYEFAQNLKGDCDTRSLFLYTILKHYKYDVAVLTSNAYSHAILGINIQASGKYKKYRGKKYYVWETTAKGMRIGQLSPQQSNMRLWKVDLI